MTVRLAGDDPQTLHAAGIGDAWLAVAGRILADGIASTYDGLPVREISHVTLAVKHPGPEDEIIARLAEPERLACGNLVELAGLQHSVADALGRPVGRLLMVVKSAHVYESEFGYVHGVLGEACRGRLRILRPAALRSPAARRHLPSLRLLFPTWCAMVTW